VKQLACAALAAVLLTAAAGTAAAAPPQLLVPGAPFAANARLSDEATLSRYAYARVGAPVRATPS
jgi:hypothetical protein